MEWPRVGLKWMNGQCTDGWNVLSFQQTIDVSGNVRVPNAVLITKVLYVFGDKICMDLNRKRMSRTFVKFYGISVISNATNALWQNV